MQLGLAGLLSSEQEERTMIPYKRIQVSRTLSPRYCGRGCLSQEQGVLVAKLGAEGTKPTVYPVTIEIQWAGLCATERELVVRLSEAGVVLTDADCT